jgi:hypothetical protein
VAPTLEPITNETHIVLRHPERCDVRVVSGGRRL